MTRLIEQVRSGKGGFGRWIAELHDHYRRKTGLDLYPGTLNVLLPGPFRIPAGAMRLEAHEYGGTTFVNSVPCRICGRLVFILRTDRNERGEGAQAAISNVGVSRDPKVRHVPFDAARDRELTEQIGQAVDRLLAGRQV